MDIQATTDSPFLAKWERDLQTTFTTQQKEHIPLFAHKSSLCSKYQEISYKFTTRWYRTPSVLAKIFPNQSDRCWRCEQQAGTILHIFWECPKLQTFWQPVLRPGPSLILIGPWANIFLGPPLHSETYKKIAGRLKISLLQQITQRLQLFARGYSLSLLLNGWFLEVTTHNFCLPIGC